MCLSVCIIYTENKALVEHANITSYAIIYNIVNTIWEYEAAGRNTSQETNTEGTEQEVLIRKITPYS